MRIANDIRLGDAGPMSPSDVLWDHTRAVENNIQPATQTKTGGLLKAAVMLVALRNGAHHFTHPLAESCVRPKGAAADEVHHLSHCRV